jgi:hypothetical protein
MKILFVSLLLLNSSISGLLASQDTNFIQIENELLKGGLKQRKSTFKYHKISEANEPLEHNIKMDQHSKVKGLNSSEVTDDMKTIEFTLARSSQEDYVQREELDKFIMWMVTQYKRPFNINHIVSYLKTVKDDYTAFKICAKASYGIEKEEHLLLLRDLCLLPKGKETEISGLKF